MELDAQLDSEDTAAVLSAVWDMFTVATKGADAITFEEGSDELQAMLAAQQCMAGRDLLPLPQSGTPVEVTRRRRVPPASIRTYGSWNTPSGPWFGWPPPPTVLAREPAGAVLGDARAGRMPHPWRGLCRRRITDSEAEAAAQAR
ncbi:hypothetical protein [Streptomyces sp. NPDC006463]|uniref:hypothetical protein n=1 Tax=Streptomyces sp. NPDC006463 TaxID=3364746 RepID=UPI00369F2969